MSTPTKSRARPRVVTAAATALTAILAAVTALLVAAPGGTAQSAAAPANTAPPAITGVAAKGQTLTASSGSWSGTTPITFAFQWQRCDTNGANCSSISGATGSTYVLATADVGSRLRVRVTATNADGTATALSDATAVVTAVTGPVSTAEPKISGTTTEGQTLTATSGSWSGTTPITYAYQWVRCGTDGGAADGSNCATIAGATKSTYTLVTADVGSRLRVRVTATNADGSTTVASNATSIVAAGAPSGKPVNTSEPRISGTTTQGQTLTASGGSWTGASPITLSYQWVRCGSDGGMSDGSNCPAIPGANRTSYVLTASDVGSRLRVRVTASNPAGTTVAASNATGSVAVSGPSGIVTLPNGERSIPVTSVPSDQRLVVDTVLFSPNPVRSRTAPIGVRIKVKDTRGYVVRDARVFIRATPLVTTAADGVVTGTDGWVTVALTPRFNFPELQNGYSIQFFVKAYRAGDPVLAGVAGTRLVQVGMAR